MVACVSMDLQHGQLRNLDNIDYQIVNTVKGLEFLQTFFIFSNLTENLHFKH